VDFDHPSGEARRRRKARFDDDEDEDFRVLTPRRRPLSPCDDERAASDDRDHPDDPDDGSTWSSWPDAVHGPRPRPDWVVTEAAARDTDLGVLKTGKEADVHLVRRALPDGRSCLLAAKRYRDPRHRMFHRDAVYTQGRRVRRSREMRAMARRTEFGRELLAGQWAAAEFEALGRLWQLGRTGGIAVPYPVQLRGTELLLEFLGEPDGTAAPRLAQLRPDPATLADYWRQLLDALGVLAGAGLAHGDLSPYNVLVHHGRLVLIDLPQVVDVVANPFGPRLLTRDVRVMSTWFRSRGLDGPAGEADRLARDLLADAGLPTDTDLPDPGGVPERPWR
jgi:RIO kinase 1